MADYPPTPSYGVNYGDQNNNYMPSYDQQQFAGANDHRVPSNPTYPNPPPAGPNPNAYAAYNNMAASQYNSNVPAFASTSFQPTQYGTNMPSNMPSYQIQSPWNAPVGFPTATGWQQQPFNFPPNPPPPQYNGLPRVDTNLRQHAAEPGAKPAEEGELSEGEFEDNYQGKSANTIGDGNMSGNVVQNRPDSREYQYNPSPRETAHRDSPVSGGPPSGPRAVAGQSLSRRKQGYSSPQRRQSDTYSPYGSPHQGYANGRSKRQNRRGGYGPKSPSPRDFYEPSEQSQPNFNHTLPKKPISMENEESLGLAKSNGASADGLHEVPDDDRYSPQLESTPTPDKRVLAQHAILNLMAAKVQFQDYVDEGIDETVVHGLFDSLGMPQSRAKIVPKAKESSQTLSNGHTNHNIKPINTQSRQSEPSSSPDNLQNSKVAANGDSLKVGQQMTGGKELTGSQFVDAASPLVESSARAVPDGEERKDRIARLLAEKQNKPSQAAAAATKAEKDRQLNIKLENLRKSREARALKSDVTTQKAPVAAVSSEAKSSPVIPVSPLPSSSQIPQQPTNLQPKEFSHLPESLSPRVSPSTLPHPQAQMKPVETTSAKDDSIPLPLPMAPKPAVIPQPVPAPAIPGLFLSATGATASATANGIPLASGGQQRKRPVAADFDEPTPINAYKRPFGQSRVDKPLVIDVSESEEESDDDEGSAMDLDQPDHVSAGPTIFPKAGPTIRSFPPPPPSNNQVAQSVQSNIKAPTPDILQSKMDAIAEMHKRIAEAEAKKKARLNSNRSGSQTPLTAEVANAQQNLVNEAIAEKNQASAELERLLESAEERIATPEPQKVIIADVAKEEKVSERKSDIERKRKRRSEIQLGLPVVDAEVERNQQRVEELQAEMEKAQTAIRKALEDKQKLEDEMAKLGDEAEEQLQTEQQVNLTLRGTPSARATPQRVSDSATEEHIPQASSSISSPIISTPLQNGVSHEDPSSPAEVISQPLLSQAAGLLEDAPPLEEQADVSKENLDTHASEEQEPKLGESDTLNSISSTEEENQNAMQVTNDSQQIPNGVPHAQSPLSVSADQVLEDALQQASAQAEAESGATDDLPAEDIPADDVPTEIDNTYAPDPSQLEPASSPLDIAEDEGQHVLDPQASVQDLANEVEVMDEDSDAYEPPEATPPAFSGDELVSSNSPPFSPAPPNVVSEFSLNDVAQLSTNSETLSIEPLGSQTTVPVVETKVETQASEHISSKPRSFFTPYESPLKPFSTYRFNKRFSDEVAGGFQSPTYSHRIDPMKEFCHFELQGGICNDTACEFQHFKDVNLADDMILLQLGDSETFNNNPELKDSFVTGLRGVLQDLKGRRVRDFSTIASEIAAFRTKFNEEHLVL